MVIEVFAHRLLDESPRWLMHHGKQKAAEKVLLKIEKINGGKPYAREEILALNPINDTKEDEEDNKSSLREWWNLIKCPILLIRLLILGLAW